MDIRHTPEDDIKKENSIKIGITVDQSLSPYSSLRLMRALLDNQIEKSVSIEYFDQGINYILHGIPRQNSYHHDQYISELVVKYFETFDGLVIPGNSNNINENFYRKNQNNESEDIALEGENNSNNRRNKLEIALVIGAVSRGVPIFGICGGNQIMNIALGGTIHTVGQTSMFDSPEVTYFNNTQLKNIISNNSHVEEDIIRDEHSRHSQAIEMLAPALLISAYDSNKNVIKAVELKGHHPFAIGTQFHPEHHYEPDLNIEKTVSTTANDSLFKAFLTSCIEVKKNKESKLKALKLINEKKINFLHSYKDKRKSTTSALMIEIEKIKKNPLNEKILANMVPNIKNISGLVYIITSILTSDNTFEKNEEKIKYCLDLIDLVKDMHIIKNVHDIFLLTNLFPSDKFLDVLNKNKHLFHNVEDVILSIKKSKCENKNILANDFIDKLQNSHDVYRVVNLLPEEHKINFIHKNLKLMNSDQAWLKIMDIVRKDKLLEFILTLGYLPLSLSAMIKMDKDDNPLNLLMKFKSNIKNAEDMFLCFSSLPSNFNSSDKEKFYSLLSNIDISEIPLDRIGSFLIKIPGKHQLEFLLKCKNINKVSSFQQLNEVFLKHISDPNDKYPLICKMDSVRINSMVGKTLNNMINCMKSMSKSHTLAFAIKFYPLVKEFENSYESILKELSAVDVKEFNKIYNQNDMSIAVEKKNNLSN